METLQNIRENQNILHDHKIMYVGLFGHSAVVFHTRTHTRLTALFRDYPGGRYQKGKTNLDFTEARDDEWQWHQLGEFFTGRMPFLPSNQQRQSTVSTVVFHVKNFSCFYVLLTVCAVVLF